MQRELNTHQKFQKLSPTIFNLKTDFVIVSCAYAEMFYQLLLNCVGRQGVS